MPIYRYNDDGVWQPMANIYRYNDNGEWQPMNAVYRYNDGGVWQVIYLRNENLPSISTAPTLVDQFGSDFYFTQDSTITLDRGTWTNTGSTFTPVYYDLKIQYKSDSDTTWTTVTPTSTTPTNPVGTTGYNNYSTVSYDIALTDVRKPSYSYRGRVQVKNDIGESIAYTTTPVRSSMSITVDAPTVSVYADRIVVDWTTTPANNSSNIFDQTVEIITDTAYTYNGNSFNAYDTVYTTTVAAGTGSATIYYSGTNIRPLGSFYASVIVTANDTDETTDFNTSNIFNTPASTYSFAIGNNLYVGTNGYIGFDAGSSSTSIPSTGRVLSIYPHDLAYNDIKVWSNNNSGTNSTQYVVYYDAYQYGQAGVATYRLRYMAKFYTDQPYVDVKILTRGSNLPASKTVGVYSQGLLISGLPGPYALSAGTTFRVYYTQSSSSAFGIAFTEIPTAAMVFPGTVTNGSSDDGFWNISTANNVYTAPSYSSGPTLATRSSTFLTFSRTGANDYSQTAWVARTGSHSGSINSSGTYTDPSTPVQVTGLSGSITYYITFTPQNSLGQNGTPVQFTEFTSAPLNPPTSVSIGSVSRATDSTVNVSLNFSGGSGPYYQMYWVSSSTTPVTASYDAASTGSPITETFSFAANNTYYFYVRSSTENLGNTTVAGTGTAGTYSAYSSLSPNPSYTFTAPTGGTASISGSTSVGSTLTLSTSSPSASPAATGTTIIWRRADGGPGGNTFTGGSILQNGGTTYVIDSPLVAYSSVGYAIRAEVTFNNGVGSQTANSNSIVVTAPVVAPTNASIPTLSPTSISVGTQLSAGIGTWNNSPTNYDIRIYRGTANVATSETLVASRSGSSTANLTYTVTQADYDSGQRYFRTFVNASNSGGSSGLVAGQERGPIATPVSIPSGGSVTLSGNSTVGSVITASTSGWSGSPTSYDVYITTALSPNTPTSSSSRVASSGGSSSTSYTITSGDAVSPVNIFRAFATASNSAGTSGTVQSSTVITTTQSGGGGGGGSAPVLVSISGNNSLALGGTFSWSFSNSPTSYSVFCQGPTGTVFTTSNQYTYSGTTFRPGYDGTGWQGSGNYTIYVSARNSSGDSAVASQTTFMN